MITYVDRQGIEKTIKDYENCNNKPSNRKRNVINAEKILLQI